MSSIFDFDIKVTFLDESLNTLLNIILSNVLLFFYSLICAKISDSVLDAALCVENYQLNWNKPFACSFALQPALRNS